MTDASSSARFAKYLGPGVDPSKISPDARILGESYLTGADTCVEPGAVIENSRLENVTVAAGARIVDSIVTVERPVKSHRCDAAGRFIAAGTDRSEIGAGAFVQNSTLINTSVEADSSIKSCWISNSHIGQRNQFRQVKMILCHCESDVSLVGPTEFSESHLGHRLIVDRCGYFEAVFSNTFHLLDFDASTKRLVVRATIDLPHVSQYGQNVICSTNSGRLLPQRDGRPLRSLGPRVRLWHDPLLSHEPIRIEPCCWVSGWTKLIGESATAYKTDESMVNDRRATLVMPFAVAGFDGDAARGLIMPGERAIGIRPDQRFPAWTFTYAPGAVIAMVQRVHDRLPPERRGVADELVRMAIQTALAMVQAIRHTEQDRAWHFWADRAERLLSAHLEADLWRFEGGQPCEWHQEETSGRWTHPRQEWTHPRQASLLEIVPDLLDAQVEEEQLLERKPPSKTSSQAGMGTPVSKTSSQAEIGTPVPISDPSPTTIDPTAQIADDAVVGPGCRIGPGVIVGPGTRLWNATLEACEIGTGSLVERCRVRDAMIGSDVTLRSSVVEKSRIGNRSTVEMASVIDSTLAELSTVSAMVDLRNVVTKHGTILGSRFESARIETCLMSMHLAGWASNVVAETTPVMMDDGRTVHVKGIPMIGGGARCDGTPDAPIRMEGCFVGSNAHLMPGVRLGFGSFVLGQIESGVELPPFTLAFGGDPTAYRLGQVLTRLPEVVISHFLGWTYQASSPDEVEAVARLVEASIERGIASIRAEQARRRGNHNTLDTFDTSHVSCTSQLFNLNPYSDTQLEQGLTIYKQSLTSGDWRMTTESGELLFYKATSGV